MIAVAEIAKFHSVRDAMNSEIEERSARLTEAEDLKRRLDVAVEVVALKRNLIGKVDDRLEAVELERLAVEVERLDLLRLREAFSEALRLHERRQKELRSMVR